MNYEPPLCRARYRPIIALPPDIKITDTNKGKKK